MKKELNFPDERLENTLVCIDFILKSSAEVIREQLKILENLKPLSTVPSELRLEFGIYISQHKDNLSHLIRLIEDNLDKKNKDSNIESIRTQVEKATD